MKRAPIAPCAEADCTSNACIKGLCRKHYMAKYNRDYWALNGDEINEHRRKFPLPKQSA